MGVLTPVSKTQHVDHAIGEPFSVASTLASNVEDEGPRDPQNAILSKPDLTRIADNNAASERALPLAGPSSYIWY